MKFINLIIISDFDKIIFSLCRLERLIKGIKKKQFLQRMKKKMLKRNYNINETNNLCSIKLELPNTGKNNY